MTGMLKMLSQNELRWVLNAGSALADFGPKCATDCINYSLCVLVMENPEMGGEGGGGETRWKMELIIEQAAECLEIASADDRGGRVAASAGNSRKMQVTPTEM